MAAYRLTFDQELEMIQWFALLSPAERLSGGFADISLRAFYVGFEANVRCQKNAFQVRSHAEMFAARLAMLPRTTMDQVAAKSGFSILKRGRSNGHTLDPSTLKTARRAISVIADCYEMTDNGFVEHTKTINNAMQFLSGVIDEIDPLPLGRRLKQSLGQYHLLPRAQQASIQ
jgi:hypothetical protein